MKATIISALLALATMQSADARLLRATASSPSPSPTASRSIDWSTTKYATTPGLQGGFCNACYIFASVAVLESRHAIKHDQAAQKLSVQMALDCARRNYMNDPSPLTQTWKNWGIKTMGMAKGCQTGEPAGILLFGRDMGLALENDYVDESSHPLVYDGTTDATWRRDKEWTHNTCLAANLERVQGDAQIVAAKVAVKAPSDNRIITSVVGRRTTAEAHVAAIESALETGPVAVAIDKSSWGLGALAAGGEVVQKDCAKKNPDHAVAIMGYGTAANGQEYWVVRNSWGSTWGDGGNFKIPKGTNHCGIEKIASWVEF